MPLSREHILEAALLTAKKPLSVRELRRLFDDELSHADVLKLLESLSAFWRERGLRLREVAGGWRMETAPEATPFLFKLKDEDISFAVIKNQDTNEMLLSGIGEPHLDILNKKLKNKD